MSLKFVFIGAGNLATHLSLTLKINGFQIAQVYSRTEDSAKELAKKLDCGFTNSTGDIHKDADVYVIALKDSAYEKVLPQIDFGNKLVIHCSGSTPLSVLSGYAKNYGVLYPLQTFSKEREVNFREIPVFVEGNSAENKKKVLQVAHKISGSVALLNSEKRIYLHIAAVFVCNFVNHFYSIGSDILHSENISFDVLKPLIKETADKIKEMEPHNAQTGPAVRYDENIISKHLEHLKGKNNYDELYSLISKSIFEHHQN